LAISIPTGRGIYLIDLAGKIEVEGTTIVVPLKLEHQGGLERIALLCRIDRAGDEAADDQGQRLIALVAPSIEQDFERVREQALKSIRNDKRLFELHIDPTSAGSI
jgi:hypothetical protein